MSTFDEIAAQQGWNADSRETVLRTYISLDSDSKPASLEEFAQSVAHTENAGSEPVLKVPPFEMDVAGEYQGNAYPETREYRIHMIEGSGDDKGCVILSVEDSSGGEVTNLLMTAEEIEGVIEMAGTNHQLDGYTDLQFPSGLGRALTWDLGAYSDYVVINEGQIDEIADWLRYATGLDEWTGGDTWEER